MVLGLLSFYLSSRLLGAELDQATLPRLLAQPISRLQILLEKLLAAALLIAFSTGLVLSVMVFTGHDLPIRLDTLGLTLLVGLASGPAFSLLTGDSLQAFWLSFSLPLVTLTIAGFGWELLGESVPGADFLPVLFLPYSALILALGIRRLRAFEIAGHAGHAGRTGIEVASRNRHLLSELVLKELRLQRSALLLIPIAIAGWCLVWWVLPAAWNPQEDVVRVLAYMPLLTLTVIVPALVGASAVAAERRSRVLAWQLALPVSRRVQWGVKIAVCGALTLAIAALGLGLYRIMTPLSWYPLGNQHLFALSTLTSGAALLVGLYGSKLARDPFRAFGLASTFAGLVVYTLFQMSFVTGLSQSLGWLPRWLDRLHIFAVLTPLATLTVVALTVPRQELWLSAPRLRHAAGLAALSILLVATLGLQIAGFETISSTIEQQIRDREREMAGLDVPKELGWLVETLGLEVGSYRAEELIPLLEFARMGSFMAPELALSSYYRPATTPMRVLVQIDGFDANSTLNRWYWMRALKGFPSRAVAEANSTFGLATQTGDGLPYPPLYSLAWVWRQQYRRDQLDRSVRLEIVAEALRVGDVLKDLRDRDPQRFQRFQQLTSMGDLSSLS